MPLSPGPSVCSTQAVQRQLYEGFQGVTVGYSDHTLFALGLTAVKAENIHAVFTRVEIPPCCKCC